MSECLKATVELECGIINLGEIALTLTPEYANGNAYVGYYYGYHDPADLGAMSPTTVWDWEIGRLVIHPESNNFEFRFRAGTDYPASIMIRFPELDYAGWYVAPNDDDIYQVVTSNEVWNYFVANIGVEIPVIINAL